jgi:hypothetical protein
MTIVALRAHREHESTINVAHSELAVNSISGATPNYSRNLQRPQAQRFPRPAHRGTIPLVAASSRWATAGNPYSPGGLVRQGQRVFLYLYDGTIELGEPL